jgi:hypothetical protein
MKSKILIPVYPFFFLLPVKKKHSPELSGNGSVQLITGITMEILNGILQQLQGLMTLSHSILITGLALSPMFPEEAVITSSTGQLRN